VTQLQSLDLRLRHLDFTGVGADVEFRFRFDPLVVVVLGIRFMITPIYATTVVTLHSAYQKLQK
jgi:hypothetical protein